MMDTKHTPGPWRWVFVSTAGNWFLLGNNGEGPIVTEVPDTPDGNLIKAAPDLQKALTEGIGIHPTDDFATDLETIAHFIKMYYPLAADDLRRKAKAIRAVLAGATGGGNRE